MLRAQVHRCRGLTLISMMIGLLLGSIAVVSIATLYKLMLAQTSQAKVTSRQDTESALALRTLPNLMMKAGYGVRGTNSSCSSSTSPGPLGKANVDVVLLSDATLSTTNSVQTLTATPVSIPGAPVAGANPVAPVTGNALVWHWVSTTGDMCSGLLALNGGLVRLQPVACTNATSWNSLAWASQQIIPNRTNPTPDQINFGISFAVAAQSSACIPYGAQLGGASASGLLVTVTDNTISSSAQSVNAGPRSVDFSTAICLPNICG